MEPLAHQVLETVASHPECSLEDLLTLVLGVKMWWLMFLVEHPNDDPEEDRNDRHVQVYRRPERKTGKASGTELSEGV